MSAPVEVLLSRFSVRRRPRCTLATPLPFVPETPAVRDAVLQAAEVLTLPNGGVLPGEDWRGNPFGAWTPETAMFALQAALSLVALEDGLPTPPDPCAARVTSQEFCR